VLKKEIEILDKFIKNYEIKINQNSNFNLSNKDIENKLSIHEYKKLLNTHTDISKARDVYENDNRIFLDRNDYHFLELKSNLTKLLNLPLKDTGFYLYPPFSYCGWHTNSDEEGHRIYYVYSMEENKSFFRSIDNGNIITKYDKLGWNKNEFDLYKNVDKLNWHCIGSYTNRLSIGFTILENQKTKVTLL
jgi:hypothetical protein